MIRDQSLRRWEVATPDGEDGYRLRFRRMGAKGSVSPGERALFSGARPLTSSRRRWPSLPNDVRWAMDVPNGSFTWGIHLTQPRAPPPSLPSVRRCANWGLRRSGTASRARVFSYGGKSLRFNLSAHRPGPPLRYAGAKIAFHFRRSAAEVVAISPDSRP